MANKNAVGNALTGVTGTGSFVGSTSPTLVTPALGTPSSGNLANCTGLPYKGFYAYRSTSQSIADATFTKIQLNVENWDTENDFDSTTNFRHTPTLAGKWLYCCRASISNLAATKQIAASIFKNGSEFETSAIYNGTTGSLFLPFSVIVAMNGSTDYVEFYMRHSNGSSLNTSTVVAYYPMLQGFYLGT